MPLLSVIIPAQDGLGLHFADSPEDGHHSDDSIFKDQDEDEAQAVLQPAISAAASHLTSSQTPAIEKKAALEHQLSVPYLNFSPVDATFEGDGESTPEAMSSPDRTPRIGYESPGMGGEKPRVGSRSTAAPGLGDLPPHQLSGPPRMPSPWLAGPRDLVVKDGRSQESRGMLSSAFGPTRHHRSRSAGQEALKKLQKAFPSLSTPSHLRPSLPSSFFSSFSDKSTPSSHARTERPPVTARASHTHPAPPRHSPIARPPLQPRRSGPTNSTLSPVIPRPKLLRRVTSDESILYHNLSRTSSLGEDDDRFQDVREMVNMRLMALKDSLPEVPNFKMPTLARLQAASKRSSMSINTMFWNDSTPSTPASQPAPERSSSTTSREGQTAIDRTLEDLTGDIVILGGYRGSVLRSAEPPHQQVWAPVKLGLNMRKVNLEVGLEEEDELNMEDTIIPSGMLKHIGPIDVSRKLFKKLRSCDNAKSGRLRVWDYGYDWRLSPARLSKKLQDFLEKLPSNRAGGDHEGNQGALVIAHSLGGVITRHVVNQRPDLFSGVLYAGVPQRCINILGPMRNGDVVLFNEKLLTAQVNFSIRTSFVFLPEDGFCFINKFTGEEYPVDFYDPQSWVNFHLSPCLRPALPPLGRPHSSSLSSFIPNSLRARADSRAERRPPPLNLSTAAHAATPKDRTIAPQMNSGDPTTADDPSAKPSAPELRRNLEYLSRTLSATRKFRSQLAHSATRQEANAYPPFAVLYGKTIPTVYAAHVEARDAIPRADCYDDLLFRGGDGVVLAKESMLPPGYSLVRGGRVCTERGHITMLGDIPAVGKALEALVRGRRKGIGLGVRSDA